MDKFVFESKFICLVYIFKAAFHKNCVTFIGEKLFWVRGILLGGIPKDQTKDIDEFCTARTHTYCVFFFL